MMNPPAAPAVGVAPAAPTTAWIPPPIDSATPGAISIRRPASAVRLFAPP